MDFCDLRKSQNLELKIKLPSHECYSSVLSMFKTDFDASHMDVLSQVDIYYHVDDLDTRLKLRSERNSKNDDVKSFLIRYKRPNTAEVEISHYEVYPIKRPGAFTAVMKGALTEEITVRKIRTTLHVDNGVIHLDNVHRLGYFIELEIKTDGDRDLLVDINSMRELVDLFDVGGFEKIALGYRELMLINSGSIASDDN